MKGKAYYVVFRSPFQGVRDEIVGPFESRAKADAYMRSVEPKPTGFGSYYDPMASWIVPASSLRKSERDRAVPPGMSRYDDR